MKYTYEFVTPSDPITFQADDDKIALVCAIVLGNGKAGCNRYDEKGNQIDIPSLQIFNEHATDDIEHYLGAPLQTFCDAHEEEIAAQL